MDDKPAEMPLPPVSGPKATTDAAGRLVKYPLKVGGARTLSELRRDFDLFTIAVPYLYGLLTDAMLIDFVEGSIGRGARFCHKKFDRPLFAGLETPDGDTDWNYVLWAVPLEFGPKFDAFMDAVGIYRAEGGEAVAVRYGHQFVEVIDPLNRVGVRTLVRAYTVCRSDGTWSFPGGLFPPRLTYYGWVDPLARALYDSRRGGCR